MLSLQYLWLLARLRLGRDSLPPRANYAGVLFAVESEHYQLRELLKQRAIQPVLAKLLGLCDNHTLFVDIGANVGIFSLLVASQTGAQVLAIEPVRSTFYSLVNNCSLNPTLSVTPLNLALGAKSKIVDITAVPGSGINQVASVAERIQDPFQSSIQISMDQLFMHDLASAFSQIVVKIDVERYEFEVLEGMKRFLGSGLPIALCVEVEPSESFRLSTLLASFQFNEFRPINALGLPVLRECDNTNRFYQNSYWAST